MSERRIFSFGYEGGKRPGDLLGACQRLDAVLVDVRFSPRSRNPQWNRKNLETLFGDRYVWCQAFGNVLYKTMDIKLDDPDRGVQEVAALLQTTSIVLMCVCADGTTCHRATAAALLRERLGIEAVELDVALAQVEPRQASLFEEAS